MDSETLDTDVESKEPELSFGQKVLSEVKFFAGLFAFMLCFLTFVWGHYRIPSESMLPTLEVGDHLYVSKYAYGYSRHSLPFGMHHIPIGDGKIFSKLPKRGDVVVFRNPNSGIVMIKRAAGLPGDKIEMIQGRLSVNGTLVEREYVETYKLREHKDLYGVRRVIEVDVFREQFEGEKKNHLFYEVDDYSRTDNMNAVIVPPDTIFFMGDHRDNSVDSRAPTGPGFVPLSYLIGRADLMMFSFKRCNKDEGLRCPPRRFMNGL